MHRLLVIILSVMLTLAAVAPVLGQAIPVTPAPNAPSTIVREVSEAAQTLGTLNVVLLAVVAILVVVVVIVLVVAWKGLAPLLGTIRSLNDAREDLQEQLFKRLEAGDKERAQTADINQRTVARLSDLETRTEAQASRQTAVQEINAHTDTVVQPIDGKLQTVAATLEELKRTVVTKQVLDAAINPLVERIDAALQVIHDLQQPAPAPETASADGGKMDAAEKG